MTCCPKTVTLASASAEVPFPPYTIDLRFSFFVQRKHSCISACEYVLPLLFDVFKVLSILFLLFLEPLLDPLLPFYNISERFCISFHFFFLLQLHSVSYYIFPLTESLLLLKPLPFLFGPSNPGLLIRQLSSLASIFARAFLKDELMLGHRNLRPHRFSSIESLKGLQCS